jgi:ParB/RepB/Spo0J family partition protein
MSATAVAAKSNGTTPHPPPLASPPKFVASALLALDLIEPDPHNPRKDFPKEEMNELISSVMLLGVRQPIEVRPIGGKYRIVFGERRYRAAKAAGLKEIPAVVRSESELEASDVQMAENLKRADLSPLEIAGGYKRQLELGRTMDQVCERAGKKRTQVYAMLQLLQLGDAGRKALGEKSITTSVAQLVARVPKALQDKALSQVLPGPNFPAATYAEAEKALADSFTVDLKKAPFDTKDAKLCAAAGACDGCPKRSGNAKDLYPDIKSPDICTDRPCFDAKVYADIKRVMDAKGYKLLTPKEAPPDELFWNDGRGPLKPESGYVTPAESCFDDTQQRKYDELIPPEQLKKLVVVAIDSGGTPRQLLPKAGLMREVKKAGIFKEKKAREAKALPAPKAAKESKPAAPPPPSIDELVDDALVGKMVEAVEKRGITPVLLRLVARELLGQGANLDLFARRKLKDPGAGRPSEREFEKTFGNPGAPKLFGLIFELVVGARYMNGDGFDDLADELGVDAKKVRAEAEAAAAPKAEAKPSLKELVAGKGDKLAKAVAAHTAKKAKTAVKNGGRK